MHQEIFVGRELELRQLEQAVFGADARPVAITAIHGMAGVGKSYLVQRFFQRHRTQFPGGCHALVLDPKNPRDCTALIRELGDLLKVPVAGGTGQLRAVLVASGSAVYLENVDSASDAAVAGQLARELAGVKLIVTARFHQLGAAAGWTGVPLAVFDEATALELLERELPGEPLEESHCEMLRVLGYLPLAIHLAAGYLRFGDTPGSFLALLRATGLDVSVADDTDRALSGRTLRAVLQCRRRRESA